MPEDGDRTDATPHYRYDAFISYSHAADHQIAPALQRTLERIACPWYRLRALRVFRDRTNLSVQPELWGSIVRHLSMSRWFLMLASPEAAKSKWVRKEIDWWIVNRSPRQLLIVLTDGEIRWDDSANDFDWTATTSLPKSLANRFAEEPHYGDFRTIRAARTSTIDSTVFRDAALAVAATLRNVPKDELDGEAVRTLRLNRLWASAAVSTVMVLLLLALSSLARSREEQWNTAQALRQSQSTLANALAGAAARFRELGDSTAAVRLLAEASGTAFTPLVHANVLATEELPAKLQYVLPQALATRSVSFAPQAPFLALGLYTGEVVVVDSRTGAEIGRVRTGDDPIVGLAFSPAGDRMYALSRWPADAAWNSLRDSDQRSAIVEIGLMPSGSVNVLQRVQENRDGGRFESIAVHPRNGRLIVGTESGVRQAGTLSELDQLDAPPVGPSLGGSATVTVSPGGEYIGSTDTRGRLRVLSVATGEEYRLNIDLHTTVYAYTDYRLSFDMDEPRVVFGAPDGRAYTWCFMTDREPRALPVAHDGGVAATVLSGDGNWLATGGWDGVARITRTREACTGTSSSNTGEDLLDPAGHNRLAPSRLPGLQAYISPNIRVTAGVSALAFSPDTMLLAMVQVVPVGDSKQPGRWLFGRVHVWSLAKGVPSWAAVDEATVSAVGFDERGRLLSLMGGRKPRLRLDGTERTLSLEGTLYTPSYLSQVEHQLVTRIQYGPSQGRIGGTSYRSSGSVEDLLIACQSASGTAKLACIIAARRPNQSALSSAALMIRSFDSEQSAHVILPVETIAGIVALVWNADSTRLALAVAIPMPSVVTGLQDAPTRVFVYEARKGTFKEVNGPLASRARALSWRPGTDLLAISDSTGAVGIVDDSGQEVWQAAESLFADRPLLAFSSDGRRLFAAMQSSLRSWTWSDGDWAERVAPVGLDFRPTAMIATPDTRLLVIGEESGRVSFRDARTLEVIASTTPADSPILELAIRSDALRLAILTQCGLTMTGHVPGSIVAAERSTNWALSDGQLVPLGTAPDPALQVPADQIGFDGAAAQLWRILVIEGAVTRERVGVIGWLLGKRPLRQSVELESWARRHADHPFAPLAATLVEPD